MVGIWAVGPQGQVRLTSCICTRTLLVPAKNEQTLWLQSLQDMWGGGKGEKLYGRDSSSSLGHDQIWVWTILTNRHSQTTAQSWQRPTQTLLEQILRGLCCPGFFGWMKRMLSRGREVQNEHQQALEHLEKIQGEQVSTFEAHRARV